MIRFNISGRISIVVDILYPLAATNSSADIEAQKREIEFFVDTNKTSMISK